MRIILVGLMIVAGCACAFAQTASAEKRVPLNEIAIAFDAAGSPALEATLRTTSLNGAVDSPVTNIRVVVKNRSAVAYAFVTGLITFYDGADVRCGEGMFKAGALAVDEAFETDAPGVRIRCAPATWRIVATNLLPRMVPSLSTTTNATSPNLLISVDGEEHPIQLDRPMVVNLGNAQRTIIVRQAP
ncbi:MAG TPA: hypothetical protein VEW46_25600 [Pyrinomonadaceae bacterium]|nr:hypothetical protein [Pyrinomonadaceae bacterium]